MKLIGVYSGTIPTMHNTPCKVAVFVDCEKVKVYQKEYFRNGKPNPNYPNWRLNVNFKKYKTADKIVKELHELNFVKVR